jgi:hypothetical protein
MTKPLLLILAVVLGLLLLAGGYLAILGLTPVTTEVPLLSSPDLEVVQVRRLPVARMLDGSWRLHYEICRRSPSGTEVVYSTDSGSHEDRLECGLVPGQPRYFLKVVGPTGAVKAQVQFTR